jgi:hypothetical protein
MLDQGLTVEFVQVKANESKQLWSVSQLCGGTSDSIVAKSLAHDRCSEPCWFRIVTRADINPDLRPLRLDRASLSRCLSNPDMLALHQNVSKTMGNTLSPRGRSVSHWLADTVWEVAESEQAITDRNTWRLQEYLEKIGETLFTDQLQELYNQMLFRVQQASFPKWKDGAGLKKLVRKNFEAWLIDTVNKVKGYAPTKAGTNLKRKMNAALLPESAIDNADMLRRAYRTRMLNPKYQQDEDLKSAELEVTAVMQHLLSELDAGYVADNGLEFHARCLQALNALRQIYPHAGVSFLQGVLYSATDRCRHRFLRTTP